MPSKRFNMWMEDDLLERIKSAAKTMGLKAAPYIRIVMLEKLGDIPPCQDKLGPKKTTKC